MARLLLILLTAVVLAACTQPPGQRQQDEFGTIDTLAIASDTTMQKGMEVSYEYHQTLPLNEQEVYDVLAWGKPSQGHVMFVRRTKATKDTVLIAERQGPVLNGWVCDLNNNGRHELMLLTRFANAPVRLIACELNKGMEPTLLNYEPAAEGWDTIYYNEKKRELIHNSATYVTAPDSVKTESGRILQQLLLQGTQLTPKPGDYQLLIYDKAGVK